MSTAFVIAMLAVIISIGVVFMGVRASKGLSLKKRDGGDRGATNSTSSSSSDCAPGDSGGCDGGGGGGD